MEDMQKKKKNQTKGTRSKYSYNGRMPSFSPSSGRTEGFCLEKTGRETDLIGHWMRKIEGMVLKNLAVSAFARRGVPVVYSSHRGHKSNTGQADRSSNVEFSNNFI